MPVWLDPSGLRGGSLDLLKPVVASVATAVSKGSTSSPLPAASRLGAVPTRDYSGPLSAELCRLEQAMAGLVPRDATLSPLGT